MLLCLFFPRTVDFAKILIFSQLHKFGIPIKPKLFRGKLSHFGDTTRG